MSHDDKTTRKNAEEVLVNPFKCFLRGLSDSCQLVIVIQLLWRNTTVRSNVVNCIILNGALFLGSLVLYQLAILPMIHFILSYQWGAQEYAALEGHQLWVVEQLLWLVFNVFWILPMFLLAKALNAMYCQQVANNAYQDLRGNAETGYQDVKQRDVLGWLGMTMADLIFSTLMQVIMLLEASLFTFIPQIGLPLSFLYNCWISSLYCFEYSWINNGWSLQRRVEYFEQHWAYFLGFGLPFTAATFFLSFMVSAATYSLLFPVMVIIATSAKPVTHDDSSTIAIVLPRRIRLCWPSRPLTHRILMRIMPSETLRVTSRSSN
eukprot:TRINITY_DN7044_c0_g1_i3.p2 TRINITY_DN7044_c0_g1~~TRINITY_DN7044_c0_g1_i3.p2  ORF type:complete len:320 (+),score=48.69 TRINITY_DN7044_c0_g1_i3:115-1074(+)